MKKWSSKSLITKVMAVNLILALTLSLIFIIMSSYYNAKISDESEYYTDSVIESLCVNLESELSRLQTLTALYKDDPSFILSSTGKLMERDRVSYTLEASRKLAIMRYSIPYAQNVVAYRAFNESFILSDGTVIDKDLFLTHKMNFGKGEVIPDFDNLNDGLTIYSRFALYVRNLKNFGSLIIQINKDKFLTIDTTILSRYDIIVLDPNNTVFISSFDQSDLSGLSFLNFGNQMESKSITIGGESYTAKLKKLVPSGYTLMVFSKLDILQKANYSLNILTYVSIVSFSIICIISVVFNTKTFVPIRNLAKKLKAAPADNEIDFISDKIDEMLTRDIEMEEYASGRAFQFDIVMNYLLVTGNEVREDMIQPLRDIYSDFYVVAFTTQDRDGSDKTLDGINSYLMDIFTCKVLNISKYLMLLIIETQYSFQSVVDLMKTFVRDMGASTRVFAGESDAYQDIVDIKTAFEQAYANLLAAPAFSGDIISTAEHKTYEYDLYTMGVALEDQQMLANFVTNGNMEDTKDYIDHIMLGNQDIRVGEYISVYKTLISLLQTITANAVLSPDTKDSLFDSFAKPEQYNPYYMYDNIHVLYDKVCRHYHDSRQATKYNIVEYIQEKYNEQISLEIIADEFHITPAYVSSWFKKNMGINISDYISSLRIEEAKRILRDNRDVKISDLGESVGFTNVATFIRQFKNHTGCTPDRYRRNME